MTNDGSRTAGPAGKDSDGQSIELQFVSAIDRNYVQPYAAMLSSFRAHNPRTPARAYLLHYDLVDDDFEFLRRVSRATDLSIELIQIPPYPFNRFSVRPRRNINDRGTMSPVAYAKAFIDRFLPNEVDRVICIDADIIIADELTGLPQCDDRFPLLAVANLPRNHHHQFNSGFMIIDLGRWRRIGVADVAERFLAEYSDALFTHDQHVLNLIFQDSWKRIDLRWNYMEEFYRGMQKSRTYSASDILEARKNPAVIHFAVGTDKPWLKKSGHPQAHLYRKQVSALHGFRTGLRLVQPGGV